MGLQTWKNGQDRIIRLTTQNCFKKCNLGPNTMANDKFHNKMNKVKLKELIESIRNI